MSFDAENVVVLSPGVHLTSNSSVLSKKGDRNSALPWTQGEDDDAHTVKSSSSSQSALPVMVENVSQKIHEHITEQCLVCYDVGIPCSARKYCNDPLSLIFPFQVDTSLRLPLKSLDKSFQVFQGGNVGHLHKLLSIESISQQLQSSLFTLMKRTEPFLDAEFSVALKSFPSIIRWNYATGLFIDFFFSFSFSFSRKKCRGKEGF